MRVFIFFLLTITSFGMEIYAPKTKKEKEILNLYRQKKMVLYLDNKEYKNEVENGKSFNQILIQMLKDYVGLDLEVKYVEIEKIRDVKNSEILGGTYINNKVSNQIVFSIPLYKEELFLVSEDLNLDLKKVKIKEISDNDIHNEIYDFYLSNKLEGDSNSKDEVFDLDILNKEKKIRLLPKQEVLNYINKVKVGALPGISIGVSPQNKELLLILNQILKDRYIDEIRDFFYIKNNIREKKIFWESLTFEEKKFIEKNSIIPIGIESEQKWSYYSHKDKKYLGALPEILEKFSFFTGIKFEVQNSYNSSWKEILGSFDERKTRMLAMVKTGERMERYIFSSVLQEARLYEVYRVEKIRANEEMMLGVVKDSFEEGYAKIHYNKKNIKAFKDYEELLKALKKREINVILGYNLRSVSELNLFNEKANFPVAFAFHRDDYMLRSIINKALGASEDIDKVIKTGIEQKKSLQYEDILNEKKEKIGKFIILTLFIVLILLAILKLYLQSKKSKDFLNDSLTKLPNYFSYLGDAEKYLSKEGECIKISLKMLKDINNSLGWKIGNDILLQFSNLFESILIDSEFEYKLYKVAGDKFYIFVETDRVIKVIDAIKEKILELELEKRYDIKNQVKITYLRKRKNENIENIFKYLEMIVNVEKQTRESILITRVDEVLIGEIERENKIKQMINDKQFLGFYSVLQPKFDIKTLEVVGAEVLARWETKELGFISPGEFIPIFEAMKKVYLVDYIMAEEAIEFIKRNKNILSDNFKLSFNVSLQTFEREDFIPKIFGLIEDIGISGENLEIELTESILALNLSVIVEKIQILKNKKIDISIDDFTAGNSSMSLLGILPVNTIKFDKSVLDMVTEENKASKNIYQNLVRMVKELGFKVVAEGIENDYQLMFLKANKVDIGQGFLYSKPLKVKEFIKFMLKK